MAKSKSKTTIEEKDVKKVAKAIETMHFREYVDFIRSPWRTFFHGFLKGTGIGLGAIVGVAVVIYLITYIINLLGGVPILGEWVEGLGKVIGQK